MSRRRSSTHLCYEDITAEVINSHKLIINATPLGTYPDVDNAPLIDYTQLSEEHFLYDLVYNPPLTKFLSEGKQKGASICNGEQMLISQADRVENLEQIELTLNEAH